MYCILKIGNNFFSFFFVGMKTNFLFVAKTPKVVVNKSLDINLVRLILL